MKKQTVMWTALPNGVTTSAEDGQPRLNLSVFISPRLQTDEGLPRPTLAQFPDFLDWPAVVAAVRLGVQFDDRDPVPAEVVAAPGDPDPSALWKAIFRPDTYLKPYEFPPLEGVLIRSFPVKNVVAHIKALYQNVAIESPTAPPRLDLGPEVLEQRGLAPFRQLLDEVAPPKQASVQLKQQLDRQLRSAKLRATVNPTVEAVEPGKVQVRRAAAVAAAAAPREVSQARMDFHQVQSFHRLLPVERTVAPRQPPQLVVPTMDFHEIVTSLGEYPMMLRRLGLVIDLQVPVVAGAQWVKIVPVWEAATPGDDITPRTRCFSSATEFYAMPGSDAPDLVGGTLDLSDEDRFEVGQIDVDGTAVKTLGLAEDVREGRTRGSATLPTVRSAGIWVAQTNRAHEFATLVLDRAQQLQAKVVAQARVGAVLRSPVVSDRIGAAPPRRPASDDPELYAEDLLRGYRMDILDTTTGAWRSLCERSGSYRFLRADSAGIGPLEHTDEGWVAAVATEAPEGEEGDMYLPETICRWEGWSLVAPRPGKSVPQEGVPASTSAAYGLEVDFTPRPGSLPRLRFGHEYRVRARLVDLAGNGLSLQQADDATAGDAVVYTRQEPLAPPAVVPRKDLSEARGETVDRVVIHSFNSAPPLDEVPTDDVSERHLAPPRTSQVMAETHGMFDLPEGMRGDAATFDLIVSRDNAPETFYDSASFALPYLPDPIALGVVVRLGPLGSARPEQRTLRIPFSGQWPDIAPFRLRVVEPTPDVPAPRFDEGQRVLLIPLAKAEVAQISLSCYMEAPQVERMGMWHWTVQGLVEPTLQASRLSAQEKRAVRRSAPKLSELRGLQRRLSIPAAQIEKAERLNSAALDAIHWMLTPSRELTLVHAVQQPLVTPDLSNIQSTRKIGSTFTRLSAHCPIDGKSTIKVDVEAAWDDPVDNITEPEPRIVQGTDHVCEIPIEADDTRLSLVEPLQIAQVHLEQPAPTAVGAIAQPERAVIALPGRKHEFGDTRYRRVVYRAAATTRFREYLPFTDEQIQSGEQVLTRTSEGVAVDVLSSARPAAPRVLYIVPTFAWSRVDIPGGVRSTRTGGGLRVYLERPWYSSGDGELLGVVLYQPRSAPTLAITALPVDRTRPYVSQWGQDPIWRTGAISTMLGPEHFPGAVATEADLSLEEVAPQTVRVAGHEVGYDADRQLWYCDLHITPGDSYYPFVRLALARYQPKSVHDATGDVKLSRVVISDFSQLAPDRAATVSFTSPNPQTATVAITGNAVGVSSAGHGSEVEVTVETSRPEGGEDLAWVPAGDRVVKLQRVRGEALWRGEVTLPARRGEKPMRLVLKEYEVFTGVEPSITHVQAPEYNRRLVYADAIEV